ncbi:hypothetical protein HDV00_003442 [Rhizophlyctis rosea]|nr:hypothetical protein HDV00_003442 [Rhizophlyctis rosea]
MHLAKALLTAAALIAPFAAAAPTAHSLSSFHHVVAIGDSLSDNGNLFAQTNGSFPPPLLYWNGRFSNGPVWVEYFTEALGKRVTLHDFAFGAATADNTTMSAYNGLVPVPGIPGGAQQVDVVVKNKKLTRDAHRTIVTFWIGANNYLNAARLKQTPDVQGVAFTSLTLLRKLRAAGFETYILPTLPSRTFAAYNVALKQVIADFKSSCCSTCTIVTVDLDAAMATLPALGITEFAQGCVNTTVVPPTRCPKDQEGKYAIWDGIHPTTKAHQVLADVALADLKTALKQSKKPHH